MEEVRYAKVAEGRVALTTTTTVEVDREELEARKAFYTDELARLDTDYANQKAAAEKALTEVEAALASLAPVVAVKR